MKKLLGVLMLLFFACNDGDIITETLEFGDTFETCGELVFYKINTNPNESLSFQISSPTFTVDDLLITNEDPLNTALVEITDPNPTGLDVDSSNLLNYRSYNSSPINIFCNDVPVTNIDITQDFTSNTGTANFTISLLEDDNDGIPAEYEDIDGDGDLENDDSDGDGLPNYLDADDDGDNVLTINENTNFDTTTLLTLAQDTDNDSIPDYLDTDDDGDTVLTIDEENQTTDNNPLNDITDPAAGADFLNPLVANTIPATAYIAHTINQEFEVKLTFSNISYTNIRYHIFEF
ncbi:hypothetical protein [Aurantibacter sp.]|uniref:hypothetical protein n=1 Tax=Aurantibacter sp. TaxID=2807103 RepID=UPI0035C87609